MNTTYTYPKRTYDKKDVKFMYMFFDNGDYLSIKGMEIADISINVYDKLIWHNKGVSPVGESGFIKLKVLNKCSFAHKRVVVYNPAEFSKGRKQYIEQRCVEEQITEIWLFDENNWHNVVIGNIKGKMDGEYLMLEFLPQPLMGSASSDVHYVNLGSLFINEIHSIDLDFENCESFVVYNKEILEINIAFNEQLDWGSSDLYRGVKSGYIRIKLEDDNTRENYLFKTELYNKKIKTKDFEQRLCGKKGRDDHDICHLYVSYYHAGYGTGVKECIEVDDIRSDEELEQIEERYDNGEYDFAPEYIGGHCAKLKDGSIVIAFGVNSEKTVDKLSKQSK